MADANLPRSSSFHASGARVAALAGLILSVAVALRFARLGGASLWYDELYTVWTSRLGMGQLVSEAIASGHPPLYYFIGHVWYSLSMDPVWVRALAATSGVATVVLAWLTGRALFSRSAGLWAGAMATVSPFLVWFSRDLTAYSFLTAASMASFYFLVKCAHGGSRGNWAGYLASTAAAIMTSWFGVLLLPAGWLAFALLVRGQSGQMLAPTPAGEPGRGRRLLFWSVGQASLGAFALVLYLVTRTGVPPNWLALTYPDLLIVVKQAVNACYVLFGGWVADKQLDTNNMMLFSGARLVLPAVLAAVTGGIVTVRRFRAALPGRRLVAVILYGAVLVIGPVIADSMMGRPTASRFFLWAAPPLLLVPAALLARMPRRLAALLGALVLASFSAFTFWELAFLKNDGQWRDVMGIVSTGMQPGDRLECFPLHLCQVAEDFYLPGARAGTLPLAGGMASHAERTIFFLDPGEQWSGYRSGYFGENGRVSLSGPQMQDRISSDVSNAARVWLVVEDDSYGAIPPTPDIYAALDTQWRLEQEWDIPPQIVRLYERRPGAA